MSTNCIRCNRLLKNPSSIKAGYGKICKAKVIAAKITDQEEKKNEALNTQMSLFPMEEEQP